MQKRKNGMARESMSKCREQCDPLLAQGRQVRADATEHHHPNFRAETAGDLLLHFDHAQISLGLVVVKGHRKIVQEPQHGPLALREAIQQIASRALFGSPRFSLPLFRLLWCCGRGIGEVAFGEEFLIATKQRRQHCSFQLMLASRFGSLHLRFHGEQQVFHLACPRLFEFFLDKGQFPQMMDVAPGLREGVALIALQGIMDAGPTKLWRNANGIQRFAPSAPMSCVVGEAIRRADVNPPPRCANAQPRFILVDDVRLHQGRFEAGFYLGQLLVTGGDKAGDAAG